MQTGDERRAKASLFFKLNVNPTIFFISGAFFLLKPNIRAVLKHRDRSRRCLVMRG